MKRLILISILISIYGFIQSQNNPKLKAYDPIKFKGDPDSVRALVIRCYDKELLEKSPDYFKQFSNVELIYFHVKSHKLPIKPSYFPSLKKLIFYNHDDINNRFNLRLLYNDLSQLKELTHLSLVGALYNYESEDIYKITSLNTLSININTWDDIDSFLQVIGKIENLKRFAIGIPTNFRKEFPLGFNKLVNIKELKFYGSYYGSDFPEGICDLNQLEILDFTETGIRKLSENIGNLKNLKELYLKSTGIINLPKSIYRLTNLTVLTGIHELSEDIGNLTNLEILDISGHFETLPSNISKLKKLKILSKYGVSIDSLPLAIGGLESLEKLSIRGTEKMSVIPNELCNLINLKKLYIVGPNIEKIPSDIGNLKNLESLCLYSHKISTIPSSISKLKKLSKLDLSGNKITKLPNEICELENLKIFNIKRNKIKEIPQNIGNLKNLESLFLGNNLISEVPSEIGKLNSLQVLSLRNNKILSLPPEIGKLNSLRSLDISSNEISFLPFEIGKLEELTGLNLSDNYILQLPAEIGNLKKLKSLIISSCKICMEDDYYSQFNINKSVHLKSLPKEFEGLLMLEELKICCSDFKEKPIELKQLKNLHTLHLHCISKDLIPDLQYLSNLGLVFLQPNNYSAEDITEIQNKYPKIKFIFEDLALHYFNNRKPPNIIHNQRIIKE